jgi:DNA helicase-2/ATP-dependent DNA helicase PcrA
VFKNGEKFEIVDWKTGSIPKDESELDQLSLQLALYRFAYSELRAVPLENIEVCFYFVADDVELKPKTLPNPTELIAMWQKLFI